LIEPRRSRIAAFAHAVMVSAVTNPE
jgi:hypothetical protein